jgi:outer membrane protein TolC
MPMNRDSLACKNAGAALAALCLLMTAVSGALAQNPQSWAMRATVPTTVESPFLGGVPDAEPEPRTLSLTLRDAVDRGLQRNLGAILGEQSIRDAEAGRDIARSAYLPTLTAGLSIARREINLEAYGFPVPPGESPVVGPFNVGDARAYLDQSILDLSAIERWRAGDRGLESAGWSYRDAREMVVLACAELYLQAALGESRIDAARTQQRVAEALHERALRLKESGVGAGIDVLRARVRLEAQRQRVIVQENEFAKQKLALARAIGLPLGQAFELADKLAYRPSPPPSAELVIEQAYAARADLKQIEASVAAAEATLRADRFERLPTIRFAADLGWIGPTLPDIERTFSVGAGLQVPLFEGGRIRARVAADDAALRRLRARRDDLRARIEYEARSALLDLDAAAESVNVARGALDLADEQLRQSQDRFSAGVAGNLEVVQAQDAQASATESFLSAMFAHDMARLALARAQGVAEGTLASFLDGGKGNAHE